MLSIFVLKALIFSNIYLLLTVVKYFEEYPHYKVVRFFIKPVNVLLGLGQVLNHFLKKIKIPPDAVGAAAISHKE